MQAPDLIVLHVLAVTRSAGSKPVRAANVRSPRGVVAAMRVAGWVRRAGIAVACALEGWALSFPWTDSERASMTCHCGDCLRYVRGGFKS